MKNRRKLVVSIGAGSFIGWSIEAKAQPKERVWRIGFLSSRDRPPLIESDRFGAFVSGMNVLGYAEGRNLVIEWRFANGKYSSLPELASELVRLKVDAIVTDGTPATVAAQKASTSIPIIMGAVADPVGSGLVKSLARPGGNTTGLTNIGAELSTKNLEWLRDMVPTLSRVALLINPDNLSHGAILKNVRDAAQKAGLMVFAVEARSPTEIVGGFVEINRQKAGAVIILIDPYFNQQQRQIAELAEKFRLPSIASSAGYPEAGGLMSYGQDLSKSYRRAASFADKIFKGVNPRDIPVEQSTHFEFVINGKTAKALGLSIPLSLLISVDKVIE